MSALHARLLVLHACIAASAILFPAGVVSAEDCTASKVSIVAGPWENTETKTSYTAQAQDSAGTLCQVSQTLRLLFESSGSGTFTNKEGVPIEQPALIASSTANRNFYYQNTTGEDHTITIKAGYGPRVGWSVLWQASHNTATSLSTDEEDGDSDTADTADGEAGSTAREQTEIAQTSGTDESRSRTLARARIFEADPLKLVLSHPKRLSVGQPAQFAATPSGLEAAELRTLRYLWSFGDGGASSERAPTHVYMHPGTYVVIGMASRAGHEIAIRADVTVSPLQISLTRSASGDLLIQNDASHEIEISGLAVSDGARTFTIPDHTYLLGKASIALPVTWTKFPPSWSVAFVYDREGTQLAQYPKAAPMLEEIMEGSEEATDDPTGGEGMRETIAASAALSVSDMQTASATTASGEDGITTIVLEKGDGVLRSGQAAAAATAEQRGSDSSRRWVMPSAFVGVLLMGMLALYAHKIV